MPQAAFLRSALFAALCAAPAAAQDYQPWRVIGPFDHPLGSNDVAAPQPVEKELASMGAGGPGPDLAAEYKGKGNAPIRWRPLRGEQAQRAELDVGLIDFPKALEPPPGVERWTENAVAYLYRRIDATEATSVSVMLGSDDGMRLWLNGKLLVDKGIPRPLNLGDESLDLELKPGANHVLVKVAQGGGGWGFEMAPWKRIEQPAIDAAIDRGADFLLATQLLDGSWSTHEGFGAGQTAYCVYTLLKCGVPSDHPAVRRGLEYVRGRPNGFTYSTACELLALEALGESVERGWMERRLRDLIEMQSSSGLFGYPHYPDGTTPPDDLSNTLYAALALRAVAHAGLSVPERTWRRLIDGTLRCFDPDADRALKYDPQNAAAGFRYRAGEGGSTGSMTTAGLSVLAIADEALGGKHSKAIAGELADARTAGLRWIERHMTWAGNPGEGGHHYFFVYGMERVGVLLGLKVLGGVDWYWSGADYLVRNQRETGAWISDDGPIDTILALLFLKRATAASTGPKPKARSKSYATDVSGAPVVLRASGDTPLAVWIEEIAPAVRSELEWSGPQGGLRVAKVEFLARSLDEGGAFELVGVDEGDPGHPAGPKRFAAQHAFAKNGRYAIVARVHALPPPADGAESAPRVLESPELRVRIEGVLDPRLLEYAKASERNLLAGEKPRVRASSQLGDGDKAELAVDGLAGTRWRSAANDEAPWLEIAFDRPLRVDRIVLTHPAPRPRDAKSARPRTVEVLLNGKERHVVDMDPDVLVKSALELEKPVRLRGVKLTIVQSIDRVAGTDGVGFAEVELETRP